MLYWEQILEILTQIVLEQLLDGFSEIMGYFESRITQGVVEGINNKLKLIKRSGYGFKNFENFKLRCLLNWAITC